MSAKRKWEKLLSDPRAFFMDAIAKRLGLAPARGPRALDISKLSATALEETARAFRNSGRPTAILIGFSDWKTFMTGLLPGHNVAFLGHTEFIDGAVLDLITRLPRPRIYCWSYKFPPALPAFCAEHGLSLTYVEDGFVRGKGLGVKRTKPLSLVFDESAMHFDKDRVSDLEALLGRHDFDADDALMHKAARLRDLLVGGQVTKYNFEKDADFAPRTWIDPSRTDRVLVLGQVEDDLSIRYGMAEPLTGNDLVRRARAENPEAQILYRPHPEARVVTKTHYSNPRDVADICTVLPEPLSLHQSFALATRVYTLTSLAGFEAVLAGLPVKVFGTPFYAGWGITEDAVPIARRTRQLTPLHVLAGAYLLYPRYYHPETDAEIDGLVAAEMMAGKTAPVSF